MADLDIHATAAHVLEHAAHKMQPYWRLLFQHIAAGGVASEKDAAIVRATAAKLKLKSPPPESSKVTHRSPSFFGALMDSVDVELPPAGKARDAFDRARQAYPGDPFKQHLTYVMTRGPRV